MEDFEKLGTFYLGRHHDLETAKTGDELLLYDSRDLVTHAVCVGMTGSGKTGLCVGLLEEAALDGIPALVIDPKGDLTNLLLTFPNLDAADFLPWINVDDARRKGLEPEAYAATEADLWRNGLSAWGQDGARIARLRQAADFQIYTPGSEAGTPVSILSSFAAPPPALIEDADLLRDRIATTVTSLLGLVGIEADPILSREHILLSSILDRGWREGRDFDLGALIGEIQRPPLKRIGVLDLESFYPQRDRFELAMRLNNLLAAPGFQSWLKGQDLNVDRLLHTADGRPRIAILSIAHLSDSERMFFVSLLLNEALGWMRSRPGTTSLRALIYMDEIFGYMPPVAEPPSKRPLLTLLKQGRAFGVGTVLATQNPVDLDYKGLSNTGTWFIGRLQTERDKDRVLDGLEGSAAGAMDRKTMSRTLSALGKRVFLLHNVHQPKPVVFQTRWVMSYLRGPLTRQQIRSLKSAESRPAGTGSAVPGGAGSAPAVDTPAAARAQPVTVPPRPSGTTTPQAVVRPMLPPDVPQAILPPPLVLPGATLHYRPYLLGLARVHFVDRRTKETRLTEEVALLAHGSVDGPDWEIAEEVDLTVADLTSEPLDGIPFGDLPPGAERAANYRKWSRTFADTLYRSRACELLKSDLLGLTSEPGESERDFRIRLRERAREERDDSTEALRRRYAAKVDRLEERLRRAAQRVEKEREQAGQQKLNAAISAGTALLSMFLGSRSTRGASSAVRGFGRISRETQDVRRAEENVAALTGDLEELNAELQDQIDRLKERYDPLTESLETVLLRPRRADIDVRRVTLAWRPTPD